MSLVKGSPLKSVAVLLGEEKHVLAPYSVSGERPVLGEISSEDSSALRDFSRQAKALSVAFSPRALYADVGDFSRVTPEATLAHIRSAVDKIGLFKEDYCISFCKLRDVDAQTGKFSYLAIPASEVDKIDLLDEAEALVDRFCPIEAALAAAVGSLVKDMAIVLYEDSRFVRIIATKGGTIYYITTINASESFDVVSDTVSGIQEMSSLLANSYRDRVQTIYKIGDGEVSTDDLQEQNISVARFSLSQGGDDSPDSLVLLGSAMNTLYDFTPEKFLRTKRIAQHAKFSLAISIILLLITGVLFVLGLNNTREAQGFQDKTHAAVLKSSRELRMLEDDYASLSRGLDLSKINNIIKTYQDFEAEPKLYALVDSISRRVPSKVFLTRIDVIRPTSQTGSPPARVIPNETTVSRSSHVDSFEIVIEGIINSSYPDSKGVFSSLTGAMQEVFTLNKATFSQKEQYAGFSLKCGTKP